MSTNKNTRPWKSALLLSFLTCALQADPILVGPIEISGSGTFYSFNPYHDDTAPSGTDWTLSFSGSNGTDSVVGSQIEASEGSYGLSSLAGSTAPIGGMEIDGINTLCSVTCDYGEFLFQQVSQGEYTGFATIFDHTRNALIQASLVGNLIITSQTDLLYNPDGTVAYSFGTFEIVNAPEPSAGSLAGSGAILLLILIAWQRRSTLSFRGCAGRGC